MKFLRINMTTQTLLFEDVPQEYAGLGGRALTSTMVNKEVPPTSDSLGSKNKLIFAPGFFSGTSLVNTSRLSVGAKSPLTGGIKESNVGGTVSFALAKLGIKAIIVEGKAPDGTYYLLNIEDDNTANLIRADELKGKRTYAWQRCCMPNLEKARVSPVLDRPGTFSVSRLQSNPQTLTAGPAVLQAAVAWAL